MHKLSALLTVALLSPLAGCSLFASSQETVAITANEPEAQIYVDGNFVGQGAVTIPLARNKNHAVIARVGGRTGAASIGTTISATGVLDVIGGLLFLIPFIGIAGNGFWSLESHSITVMVPPGN